jgi:hypothetical protein
MSRKDADPAGSVEKVGFLDPIRNSDLRLRGVASGAERNIYGSTTLAQNLGQFYIIGFSVTMRFNNTITVINNGKYAYDTDL